MWLINFGIYVGYKKKIITIFYLIKFSRIIRISGSITRKIDILKIFRKHPSYPEPVILYIFQFTGPYFGKKLKSETFFEKV
jgi:hypothetical protein